MPNCADTNFKCGIACTRSSGTPANQRAYYKNCKTGTVGTGKSYTDAKRNAAKIGAPRPIEPTKRADMLKKSKCDQICETKPPLQREFCEAEKARHGCGGGVIDKAVETVAPGAGESDRCGACDKGNIGCALGRLSCEFTGTAGEGWNNCLGLPINCGYLVVGVLAVILLITVLPKIL